MTAKVDRRQFVSGAGGGAAMAFLAPGVAFAQARFGHLDVKTALDISDSLAEAIWKRLPLEGLEEAAVVHSDPNAPQQQRYASIPSKASGPAEVKSSLSNVSRLFLLTAGPSFMVSRKATLLLARQFPVGGCSIARFDSEKLAWYGAFASNAVPSGLNVSLLDRN